MIVSETRKDQNAENLYKDKKGSRWIQVQIQRRKITESIVLENCKPEEMSEKIL